MNFKYCGHPVNKEISSEFSISSIIILIFILFIVGFLLSIIWYRLKVMFFFFGIKINNLQFNRDKIAPFTPPSFCPKFIYPRFYSDNNSAYEIYNRMPA